MFASIIIIFFCTGLMIYWISRTKVLFHDSEDEIWQTLDSDMAKGRRFLLGLRCW